MSKNMSAKQWRYVEHRIHQRRSRGKQSRIYLSGIEKDLRNAFRSKHLHVTTLEKYNKMYQRAPSMSSNLHFKHASLRFADLLTLDDEPESPKDLSLITCTPPCSPPGDEDNVGLQLALDVVQSRHFLESMLFA